ncbi:hypothetical protein [Verrucomicrobium sp. BvORR106]|uniref:hypothetical protein n=1 Tax=Verrucomicrobium sp. BvORR106 TaxID=1403819 RepID=UPI0005708B24|nr:hypothetical protein [Verrucomicrobium sp. BvORR106]
MPQLPSGLRFALDPTPLSALIRAADGTAMVHPVMAIEHVEDLCEHIQVLYFRPPGGPGTLREFDENSVDAPNDLEPYDSGLTFLAFLQQTDRLSDEDQDAMAAFLEEPRTAAFLDGQLDLVKQAQQVLLTHPHPQTRMFATMWRARCHPLQEGGTSG